MPCPECGVNQIIRFRVDHPVPGSKICKTCHSPESMWPASYSKRNLEKKKREGKLDVHYNKLSGKNDNMPPTRMTCGHMCANKESLRTGGCCRCHEKNDECSICYPRCMLSNVEHWSGKKAASNLLDVILTDVTGSTIRISQLKAAQRLNRIHSNKRILYHQTKKVYADLILQSGQFKRGSNGTLGPGIYFADSIDATDRKAIQRGPVLAVEVSLGNIHHVNYLKKFKFGDLLKNGYDSIHCYGVFNSGDEYVVYNYDQAKPLRIARD